MELFEQANSFHAEGKLDEAEELYDQLLTQNHDHAGLLATMGTLYLGKNKIGLAIHFLEHSLAKAKKRASDVVCNLALSYKYAGHHDKAKKLFEEAMQDDPTPETIANYGSYFIEAGQAERAIAIFNRAIGDKPELALAHWNLSLALLESGKWDKAWDEYEWGYKAKMRVDRKIANAPMWDGTHGKTVVIYGEQGIGDEIMFASMLPDLLKTNPVILECHERLKHLFEHSFPGMVCHGTRENKQIDWPNDADFDYRLCIGSLGKFYRRSIDTFPGTPFLKADAAPKGDKFRIGISWTGGQKEGRVRKRTVPLSWWKSILDNVGCEFISLQYTDCAEEIAIVERLGYDIKQFDEVKAHDYYETAKLVKSCDLVISVCTSVVHLAGALGVPCWVMTPAFPAWRYQNSGKMPWYRSVRLYRQQPNSSWIPVVERIGLDLNDLLDARRKQVA